MLSTRGQNKAGKKNSHFPFTASTLFLATLVLTVLSFASFGYSAQVKLTWNANTDSDLAGYKLYYGTASKTYTSNLDVGKVTSYTLSNLQTSTTYYFALSAYDSSKNESKLCTEVSFKTATDPNDALVIPQSQLGIVSYDSQETAGENGRATNAIDGSSGSIWHTQWSSSAPAYPHNLVISLGGTYNVSGFRYLPRQDGISNGNVANYSIYVSTDGTSWGNAVATGSFANNSQRKDISFTAKTGKFVKFVAESEVNGNAWANAAEVGVLGTAVTTQSNFIPQSQIKVVSASSQESAKEDGSASNVLDGNSGTIWHSEWSSATVSKHPHHVIFNLGASYELSELHYLPRQDGITNGNVAKYSIYVSNDGTNWGSAVATGTFTTGSGEKKVVFSSKTGQYVKFVAESEVNGNPWACASEINFVGSKATASSGTGVIPYSQMKVVSYSSQETTKENGAASNAIDGNQSTKWHTQYSGTIAAYPHNMVISLGSSRTVSGFRYLPRQDGGTNGTVARYSIYVSQDGKTWGNPVASGAFASNTTEKEVSFSPVTGSYVKFVAQSEINGKSFASAAEISILGQ